MLRWLMAFCLMFALVVGGGCTPDDGAETGGGGENGPGERTPEDPTPDPE